MIAFEEKVRGTIRKYRMISDRDGVLIAVSGGPDSVALLHVLFKLKEELNLRLEVAHLQHGIRGKEAQADAALVEKLANKLSLSFHFKEINLLKTKTARGKGNLEAMAREERYRFFAGIAEERNLNKVAAGHTRDDQIETQLMWLLRGSGSRGLMGIPPVRDLYHAGAALKSLRLVRPLIETSRKDVLDFLSAAGFDYRLDQTNLDTAFLRNWIRLCLLPQIRTRTDPYLDLRLAHLGELLRDEEEVLERVTRERLQSLACDEGLDGTSLLKEERAIQRRVVRLWLEATLGDLKRIGFFHVEQALHFLIQGPPQGRLSIPKDWEIVKEYGHLRLEKRGTRRRAGFYSYVLPPEGAVAIPEIGMEMQVEPVSPSSVSLPANDLEAFFDRTLLPEVLTVRNFRPGDRFQPIGMKGHKKVKELFIEKKVPLPIRRRLPLLLSGGEVLWIPGYGRSEAGKIRPETRHALRVSLIKAGK